MKRSNPHVNSMNVLLEVVSFGLVGSLVLVLIVERLVPDELSDLFLRVVPPAPSRPQGGGRRRYGDREVLAAIIFVATTGCTWRQLPPVFGPSGPTAHRRFTEWTTARVWAKLHRVILDELGSRGDLDWSRCAIDSVNMRALKGGS
ncbi:transposase [Streptomyces noursei]|uniref:Transposase n=1 Tax=Streptomyces noursei TaxID=1971 RepID=A0A401R9U8_STRNR|nr:transposase [Streptomyces noursei]